MRSYVLLIVVFVALTGFEKPSSPIKVCASAEEMKLYNLIMEYRKSKNLDPIPFSAKLTMVAQTHAKDLAENYEFKANNKCNLHSWSKKGKWTSCCYTNDHKQAGCMWSKPVEIAGYNSEGYEIAYYSSLGASAQEGIDGWKISEGHNPLLINSGSWSTRKWNALGVGIYKEYGIVWFGEIEDDSFTTRCQ